MADDQIIIEYKAKLDKLESDLSKLEKDLKGVDTASKKSMNTLETQGKQAATQVNKIDKNVSGLKDKLRDLAGNLPFASAAQDVLSMGNALTGSTKAAAGMSNGMKVLRTAIISTGIGALVIALVALIAYFKRTDDGATKLEGIMGALGAATDEVTGFVAELGSNLFDALSSVEGFKQGLSDLGDFLLNNMINRFKAFLVVGEAVGLLFEGKFKEAALKGLDATTQFTTGIENITEKASAMGDRMAKAAQEAYEFALAMDAISDAQRDLNVEISENQIRIVELIRQSKNHSLAIEDRIKKLKEANALDADGLTKTLALEEKRLELIKKRNITKKASINQDRDAAILEAKTEQERIKLREKALSITDDLADEEANQQIKINNLKKESIALQERNNNAIAALNEATIQEEIELANKKVIAEQNIQKQAYLRGEMDQKEYLQNLTNATIRALENERLILIKYGKSTEEIDAKILDIKIKGMEDETKKHEEELKKRSLLDKEFADRTEAEFKQGTTDINNGFNQRSAALKNSLANREISQTQYNKSAEDLEMEHLQRLRTEYLDYGKDVSEIDNKIADNKIKKNQETEKNIKAILAASIDVAANLINGITQNKLQNDLAEIESERNKNQLQLNSAIALIDKKEQAGQLSEKSAQAQREAAQKKAAQKEAELKKKQFETQKKADLTSILINTAVAIAKTLAVYGFTPVAAIAAAAAAAEGAVQYAIVKSKKAPQFEKGGEIKGKSHREGGELIEAERGEFVVNKKAYRENKDLVKHINEGKPLEDYFMKDIAGTMIAKQKKAEAKERQLSEAALKAIISKNDISLEHLERLVKNNKTVNLGNSLEIAKLFAKEIARNHNPEMK